MWKAFNILFLYVVLFGQGVKVDKYKLIIQVLQTAADFKNIAPVMDIISRDSEIFSYVPSECPLLGNFRISDDFGYRVHPITGTRQFHSGVDLATAYAATVHATAQGTVTFSGSMAGYGKTVVIRHKYGFVTQYSHLTYIYRKRGQEVRKGEVIGFVGSTGQSTGNHLHYEIIKNNRKVNPINFFNMNLGNELKVERTRLDIKAKDVANEIGVTPQQISNIERTRKVTNLLKYISFLRSKGVDLNNLFDRINNK